VRSSSDRGPDFQPSASGAVTAIDAISVKRTRRQFSSNARPRGFTGIAEADIV
jgi:hypothetical protein